MAIVLFAIPTFLQYYPIFLKPKPTVQPEGQPGWPLYFVGYAFYNNRKFGSLFMFGLLIDVLLRVIPFTAELLKLK
jgi:1,4-dihydroxy-2-naphthoate octaprenyltransferase